MTEKELQEMIEKGEIGTMTECAYGASIADTEKDNKLKKKKEDKKENE